MESIYITVEVNENMNRFRAPLRQIVSSRCAPQGILEQLCDSKKTPTYLNRKPH